MLSVISAVKGRPDVTVQSFNSIWQQSSNINNIEHIVVCDETDSETLYILNSYGQFCKDNNLKFKYFVKKFNSDQEYLYRNMHRDYWNPIAMQTSGDIIFGLCNDTIIDTVDYDIIMEESVKENQLRYKHNYFQIRIDDDWPKEEKLTTVGFDYCSWIILTRPCLEIFNGIAPMEISSQGADIFVASMFSSTNVPSVIDLSDKIKTKQISVQKGNYGDDYVQTERPIKDSDREEWPLLSHVLYQKKYYHHKLNNRILQSVFRDEIKWKK
jgi:hypothetical protein